MGIRFKFSNYDWSQKKDYLTDEAQAGVNERSIKQASKTRKHAAVASYKQASKQKRDVYSCVGGV